MTISLITTSKFKDFKLLEILLKQFDIEKIICGNDEVYQLLQSNNYPILLELAEGRLMNQARNSMKNVDKIIILTNENAKKEADLQKQKTHLSIQEALNKGSDLHIIPYKESALDYKNINGYLKIDFKHNIKKAFKTDGIYLNKMELKSLIDNLTEIYKST